MTTVLLPLLIAAQATTLSLSPEQVKAMSHQEIRAHNAVLQRGDAEYIRCVKTEKVGSLVAREVSCRTNAQWRKAQDIGNQDARDAMDAYKGKAVNSN
ncbi:hypothetical protein [Tsuneonella amylolytica]|uniref:hypothetical protein n=1 Tax=Tsuneonella amylolytica TaxID=2338327 RepID=UPI000EAAC15E|nr:hypothetical protein [Tsuneonella amylolytica]